MRYIKLFEDLNKAKSIIKRKMENYEKLKDLLKKHQGYIGKFTEYLFDNNVPLVELNNLYNQLLDLRNKNIVIDINNFNYEKLLDEIDNKYKDFKIKSVLKNIPPRINKNYTLSENDKNLFLSFYDFPNKDGFYRKISRYFNMNDLIDHMKVFLNSTNDTKETIIDKIKETKCKIVLDKENLLIVYVPTCEDLNILASDTLWCILRQSMFDSYTKNGKQYIIYDFNQDEYSPLKKIGITIKYGNEVSACHDMLDNSVSWLNIFKSYNLKVNDFINNQVDTELIFDISLFKKINSKINVKNICNIGYSILHIEDDKLKDECIYRFIELFQEKVSDSKFYDMDIRRLFTEIAIYHFKSTLIKDNELREFLPKRGNQKIEPLNKIDILHKAFITDDNIDRLNLKINTYGLSIFNTINNSSIERIIKKDEKYQKFLLKNLIEFNKSDIKREDKNNFYRDLNDIIYVLIFLLSPDKKEEVSSKISEETKYTLCKILKLPVDLSNSTEYLSGFYQDLKEQSLNQIPSLSNLEFLIQNNLLVSYTKYKFNSDYIDILKNKLGDKYDFYISVYINLLSERKVRLKCSKYIKKIFGKSPISKGEYILDNIHFIIL